MSTRPTSTSTRPGVSPNPGPGARAPPVTQVNTQTKLIDSVHGRILCIADIRGRLSGLNDLAREANAKAIIHTGDFGIFEASSIDRIHDRTLRHLTMYSPLIPSAQRNHLLSPENTPASIRSTMNISMLSEFPLLLSGQIKLQVPVFTVVGACEDVLLLEKIRTGQIAIENLTVIDEATTRCLDIGGVKLRLFGLGGAFVPHKMFDNGDGNATIAGAGGTMWATVLQIGELVDTAQRVYDPSETRLLVTHASPGREGILASLALVLKADLTISAGLHFRYATSWNEFSVQPDFDGFRNKLKAGKETFTKVWESVQGQVNAVIDENQQVLLNKALNVIEKIPPAIGSATQNGIAGEEPAWKNCWNWNLCDAAYGSLVLDIREGRISAELKSQGFNYAYRRTATNPPNASTPGSAQASLPPQMTTSLSNPPTKAATPAPAEKPATATPAAPAQPQRSTAPSPEVPTTSTSPTPANVKVNGVNGDKAEREKSKKKSLKEKKAEREKAEKEAAAKGGATGTPAAEGEKKEDAPPAAGVTSPGAANGEASASTSAPAEPAAASSPKPGSDGGLGVNVEGVHSPRTDSTGARTPTSRKPPRNPWTLFVRLAVPADETQLRDFFQESKEGITRVTFPNTFGGRNQKIAYVEFGDEEAMKAGLTKHAEKLNDGVPEVKIANQEPREHNGAFRGRGGGRGRGGFAARGFAAAGLTRGGGPRQNGEGGGGGGGGAA